MVISVFRTLVTQLIELEHCLSKLRWNSAIFERYHK